MSTPPQIFPRVAGISQRKYSASGIEPVTNCGENLCATGNAVREASDADDECQQVNHGQLADRPVTGGNRPGNQGDHPSPIMPLQKK